MVLKALNPGPSPPGMLRDHSVQDDTKPEAGPWNDVILRSEATIAEYPRRGRISFLTQIPLNQYFSRNPAGPRISGFSRFSPLKSLSPVIKTSTSSVTAEYKTG